MSLLTALRQEERKLEKQLSNLQSQLHGVRKAAEALGHSTSNGFSKVRKRVVSAAAKAKMSRAAKKRWAKIKATAKKAVS